MASQSQAPKLVPNRPLLQLARRPAPNPLEAFVLLVTKQRYPAVLPAWIR